MNYTYWLDSSTVRAALLGFIPAAYAIAKAFGLDLPDGTFENIVNGVAALLNVISLTYVLIGRFKLSIKPLKT